MAYFEDLTPYTYRAGETHILNVGWLEASKGFLRGPVPFRFAMRLQKLSETPVNVMRGLHYCDLCIPPQDIIEQEPSYEEVWELNRCGSGEVRVRNAAGTCFAAPALVWHYVAEHQYQPPEAFIDAVMFAFENPDSQPDWDRARP